MIIGEIEKNMLEKIVVTTQYYKGHEVIDIRVYFARTGKWIRTTKGLTITFDKADALSRLIKKATTVKE